MVPTEQGEKYMENEIYMGHHFDLSKFLERLFDTGDDLYICLERTGIYGDDHDMIYHENIIVPEEEKQLFFLNQHNKFKLAMEEESNGNGFIVHFKLTVIKHHAIYFLN